MFHKIVYLQEQVFLQQSDHIISVCVSCCHGNQVIRRWEDHHRIRGTWMADTHDFTASLQNNRTKWNHNSPLPWVLNMSWFRLIGSTVVMFTTESLLPSSSNKLLWVSASPVDHTQTTPAHQHSSSVQNIQTQQLLYRTACVQKTLC